MSHLTQLFGFRGLSSSPTSKSDTDSGVGVDTGSIGQAIEDSDLGTGVDGSEVASMALSGTDLGEGVDGTESMSAVLSNTDSGAGVDDEVPTGGYEAQVSDTDEGVVAETASTSIALSDTDSGTGADSQSLGLGKQLDIIVTSIEDYLTIEVEVISSEDE